jgi:hypothetical protein
MIKNGNMLSEEEFGNKMVEEMCNFIDILLKFNCCLEDENLNKKCDICKN